uniref:RING-type domain-containing protein n=1 Tax=Brassica oleracea TaxID=3712 RepID=A0A3P6FH35_BRAOL|nr:unnamed protein product [Brassica oleracea]VDD43569.1 unnamed protein product [Brassica oleracea]
MQEIMANFIVTSEMEYRVVRFNVAAGTLSNLVVRMVDCERTISRWLNGNEVITYYHRHDTPRHPLGPYEQINHTTEGWRVDTQEELRQLADQNQPYWQPYFAQDDYVDLANRQRVPNACPICYESIANPGARIGLECGHVYCKACIYQWIWRRTDCPTCRGGVLW